MKTIKENVSNELVIKNSKFITYLYKIKTIDDISNIMDSIKEEHPKATHHCFAYVINGISKSSDDNEPSSTAGMPMLNVLLKNDLDGVLAVTVRYFGGIKLGASGLVRAYSSSVSKALEKTTILDLLPGYKVRVILDYSNQKEFNYLIRDYSIDDATFDEKITYIVSIPEDKIDILTSYNYEILESCFIEK